MVHGKKRIPYWRDRRLNGLAGPEYHAIISFGLPIEPEDSQYGKYRFVPYKRVHVCPPCGEAREWVPCLTEVGGQPTNQSVLFSFSQFGYPTGGRSSWR